MTTTNQLIFVLLLVASRCVFNVRMERIDIRQAAITSVDDADYGHEYPEHVQCYALQLCVCVCVYAPNHHFHVQYKTQS